MQSATRSNNVSERGAKAGKRNQAVSGYWHSLTTLARWCRLRSHLDTATAHGITALDAIRSYLSTAAKHGPAFFDALIMLAEGKPWMPAAI